MLLSSADDLTAARSGEPVATAPRAAASRQPAGLPCRTFLSLAFSMLHFAELTSWLANRRPADGFIYLATPNAQHATQYNRGETDFVAGLRGAAVLTCDSRILRLLAGALFRIDLPLVAGSDLTARLFETVIHADDPITIIGGDATMEIRLRERFGLTRLALYAPPFGFSHDARELQRCHEFIVAHPARFVFLACGAPQSELLGAYLAEQGGVTGIGLCIGASLHFITGQLRRAPRPVQRLGMEWLYRLTQEPRRLAPRFWRNQLPVLWLVLRAWATARRQAGETSIAAGLPHSGQAD